MASVARLLDGDLTAILRAKEDFDINRVPFILEASHFQFYFAWNLDGFAVYDS